MGRLLIFVSGVGVLLLALVIIVSLLALAGVDRFDIGFDTAT
ncbi:MAG: hypothetical protein ACRDJW_24000 [Thermomicrobiales bacterium]